MPNPYLWPLHIGGADVETGRWTYPVHADPAIGDPGAAWQGVRDARDGTVGEGIVARVALAGPSDLAAAYTAAATAFPAWRAVPLPDRLAIGVDIHRRMTERRDELAAVMTAEGYPSRVAAWFLASAEHIISPACLARNAAELRREEPIGDRRLILRRLPDGVVAFHPPRNAAATLSCPAIPTMLAGNTLVLRAPDAVPAGVMFVFRELVLPALLDTGAPAGVCNVVCGGAKEAVDAWLDDPLIDDIASSAPLTSASASATSASGAARSPCWNSPATTASWSGRTPTSTAPRRPPPSASLPPPRSAWSPSTPSSTRRSRRSSCGGDRPGRGAAPQPAVRTGRGARTGGEPAEFTDAVAAARAAGATVLTGGALIGLAGEPGPHGPFAQPTAVRVDGLEAARKLPVVTEETFFPFLPVVPTPEENGPVLLTRVAELLNRNAYGLRNSPWTASDSVIDDFLASVSNGGLIKVNDSHAATTPHATTPHATTHGGTALFGGPHGEACYPLLRATHLQAVSIGNDVHVSRALTTVEGLPADRRGGGGTGEKTAGRRQQAAQRKETVA